MIEFLECLSSTISAAADAAQRLRQYVNKIDSHINGVEASNFAMQLDVLNVNRDPATLHAQSSVAFDPFEHMPWSDLFTQDFDAQYESYYRFARRV